MSANPTITWDELDTITLTVDTNRENPLADGVDRSAAFAIPMDQAYTFGMLPFRWDNGHLCIAIIKPLTPQTQQLLAPLGPIRLYRTIPVDLHIAQWYVYGSRSVPQKRFGEIAMEKKRIAPAALAQALSVQTQQGGAIGDICVALNALNSWDVAEVLSEQTGIPTINLLQHTGDSTDPAVRMNPIWDLFEESVWHECEMVPVRQTSDEIIVALTNPFDGRGRAALSAKAGKRVSAMLTGRRDIERRLAHHYQAHDLMMSQNHLLEISPEDSATQTITKKQKSALAIIVVAALALMVWHADITLTIFSSLLVTAYAVLVGHRLWIIRKGTESDNEVHVTEKELCQLDESTLPRYTILIPAREESSVLPVLTQALQRLDYPKDRLDVKLLLEEDDAETIAVAQAAQLPNFMEIVIVPIGEPRTKPKACNFGLQRARGAYVTIFDAEDLPEPTQLKKAVTTFRHSDASLACLQAKLSYFNAEQNMLTRWFTAEYGAWFDLLLPALHAAKMPIPLGGTSNHFRTDVLRKLGAWDPFNVTEDADLGIRLHKAGYRTAVLDSVTYEEANSEFVNWVRQRSRWIKGYLQTWLVHMRHPVQLRQQLGRRGFWGFQLSILGTPLMFILNPVYWFITSLWFMTHWGLIPHLFPPGIYYLGMLNLLVGNFVFTYLNAVGAAKRGLWSLVPFSLLTPIYWSMMSLASWKALLQLITRPSHWEKTRHGLVDWNKVRQNMPPTTITPRDPQEETA